MKFPFKTLRQFLSFLALLLTTLAGWVSPHYWLAIPAASVALLWISDTGQHRALMNYAPSIPPSRVLTLSIGAFLLNNLLFTSLCFALGIATRWFWGPHP